MAAAKAPDLGCTGAECLRGALVLDFFFGSLDRLGMGMTVPCCRSNRELVEDAECKEMDEVLLLVMSELERTGSLGDDLIMVLTWLAGLFLLTAAERL
jgi:hypothetical protein